MERRLAAILAADVGDYSRLMGADKAGTLERLTELRKQVFERLIGQHHGRIVKLMGDGLLEELASGCCPVRCRCPRNDLPDSSFVEELLQNSNKED